MHLLASEMLIESLVEIVQSVVVAGFWDQKFEEISTLCFFGIRITQKLTEQTQLGIKICIFEAWNIHEEGHKNYQYQEKFSYFYYRSIFYEKILKFFGILRKPKKVDFHFENFEKGINCFSGCFGKKWSFFEKESRIVSKKLWKNLKSVQNYRMKYKRNG